MACNDFFINENFVSFDACKLKKTKLIWVNPSYAGLQQDILNECSYMVKRDAIIENVITAQCKVFFVECYSGSDVEYHGGGTCVGFNGKWLIKGIGTTPLLHQDNESVHATGELPLYYALYEMIWSRVLSDILPYGSLPCIGVISTENKVIDIKSQKPHVLGLLVREYRLRPAHFGWAVFSKPIPGLKDKQHFEVEHVSKVISSLPSLLPQHREYTKEDWLMLSDEEKFDYGLTELAIRLGAQFGYCHSKFLKIGTSPSNVTLNGELVDFTSVDSIHPFGSKAPERYRQILTKFFEEDHKCLLREFYNLFFCFGKQVLCSNDKFQKIYDNAKDNFLNSYILTKIKDRLLLTGLPKVLSDKIEITQNEVRLSSMIDSLIYRNENFSVDDIYTPSCSFGFIMFELAMCYNKKDKFMSIIPASMINPLEKEILYDLYLKYRGKAEEVARNLSKVITSENITKSCFLNITRLTSSRECIERETIINLLQNTCDNIAPQKLKYVVGSIIGKINTLIYDSPTARIVCWQDEYKKIGFDIRDGGFYVNFFINNSIEKYDSLSSLPEIDLLNIVGFYGGRIWSVFDATH
ncbi:hypothetical protein JMY81_13025 [Brenneria goodwinii]|uniref:hypothetical protein n=1 Tax=Brenneria goodwinii TaxID=1109412 RepID=UPI000BAF6CD3|nr:hypothetical protein [Brenneria goodwinii]ATA26485.1 hypothetical protein AWC36_21585 [Brenneria goodwinii]MCG8157791.1 hypothetical protein [Brenneria goodwinii]MCG8161738.1 hypothetical protein [Brenneria goodwinii]MCG8166628.1 hypothetical protein [Brenneria goodwinii]MCG8171414.1 hypothetical protein [Brenneria goodwinii]